MSAAARRTAPPHAIPRSREKKGGRRLQARSVVTLLYRPLVVRRASLQPQAFKQSLIYYNYNNRVIIMEDDETPGDDENKVKQKSFPELTCYST